MSYQSELAAVSEGICPEHRHTLAADGWCPDCGHHGAWWSIGHDPDPEIGSPQVITRYAWPGQITDQPEPYAP